MTSQTSSTDKKVQAVKTYTLPEALKPVAKMLEDAGVPIVYGPNPIPAPETLSDQAKLAWSQLPQVPSPIKDAKQFAAVREFTFLLEQVDYERFQEPYSLFDETINGVTVMWVTPPELSHEDKVLIFIHGGGYVVNSRKTQLAFQAAAASKLGVKVASIEYPLAPEHPYPAALNAILDAYQGLCDRYGADNIGLFGTSAGGGLVLATLLRLKQEGLSLPAASASLSPGADMTLSGDLFALVGYNDPMLNPQEVADALASYPGTADPSDPLVSPVFGDYTSVTPLFLLAGTREIIGSDGIRVAARARQDGCEVTLILLDGMWHVPIADGSGIPELQFAFDEMISFFRKNLEI
jgi:acetyl esterase/lipase